MAYLIDLDKIDAKIQAMKKMAEELDQMADDFPAIAKTTARILANIRTLELNVSDLCEIGGAEIDK